MSAMIRPRAGASNAGDAHDQPGAMLFTAAALLQFQFCLRHQARAIVTQHGHASVGMLLTVAAGEYAQDAGHGHIEASDVAQGCECMTRLFGEAGQAHCLHIAPTTTATPQAD